MEKWRYGQDGTDRSDTYLAGQGHAGGDEAYVRKALLCRRRRRQDTYVSKEFLISEDETCG
jgi:hypothetical protein